MQVWLLIFNKGGLKSMGNFPSEKPSLGGDQKRSPGLTAKWQNHYGDVQDDFDEAQLGQGRLLGKFKDGTALNIWNISSR